MTSGPSPTILDSWGITAAQLTELVRGNPSLRGILLGYVAELKFQELIERHPSVTGNWKDDDHDRLRKSDRIIVYKGMEFSIEVKSLQSNSIKTEGDRRVGRAQVDASDRRPVKLSNGRTLETTLLFFGGFDILAVNCYAFREKWDFVFALNRDLPASTYKKYTKAQRSQLIASLVPVTWPPEPPFVLDPFPLIERLYLERTSRGTSSSRS